MSDWRLSLLVGALHVHAVHRLRISAGPFVARAIRLPTASLKAGVSNGAISLQYIHSRADFVAGHKKRNEERDALDMIPMRMADQEVAAQALGAARHQLLT
jgi:hypothetical protein